MISGPERSLIFNWAKAVRFRAVKSDANSVLDVSNADVVSNEILDRVFNATLGHGALECHQPIVDV